VSDADDAAMEPFERDGTRPAGKADVLPDLGDRADGGVLAVVPRHEEDALFVADVDGEGDVHAGKYDGVVERDKQEIGQNVITLQV
jgi:hypothetical protein